MSVRILRADGPVEEHEDEEGGTRYAYQVAPGGVLLVMECPDDGKWLVRKEVSANRWNEVSGRRFIGDVTGLGGIEGGKADGRPKSTKLPPP